MQKQCICIELSVQLKDPKKAVTSTARKAPRVSANTNVNLIAFVERPNRIVQAYRAKLCHNETLYMLTG